MDFPSCTLKLLATIFGVNQTTVRYMKSIGTLTLDFQDYCMVFEVLKFVVMSFFLSFK